MKSPNRNMRAASHTRVFAVVAVLLMVFSAFVFISDRSSDTSAGTAPQTCLEETVVYHSYAPNEAPAVHNDNWNDNTSEASKSITYYGTVISTEYNPQVWDFPSERWYGINKYQENKTVVFTGWKYATAGTVSNGVFTPSAYTDPYDPGDVILYKTFTLSTPEQRTAKKDLYYSTDGKSFVAATDEQIAAVDNIYHLKDGDSTGSHWYAEYTQGGKKAYVQVDGDGDGKIHVYATWGILKHYADGPPSGATTSNKANWTDGTKYTNVALVPGSSNKLKDFTGVINGAFTIRAKVINRETIDSYKLLSEEKCILSNDLIIDNVSMQYQSGKAGATTNINANSKVLIIGDGINSVKTAGVDKSGVYYGQFATIYGGKVGNNKMIIHSGTYSCIYGGGMTGCTSVTIMNGGVVLDTLGGGNPSGETTDTGKLYLYLTGLTAYSDTYTDYLLNHENEGTKVTGANCISSSRLIGESSMVVGGNGNNCASDSTYVYLTGTSDVWTIQAAGREKNSVVKGDANMEISGKAIVRNVACGCITDAKPSSDTSTDASNIKGNVNLKVRDDVYIASLVGGGYDTYLISKGACFQGSSRSINIDIDGGNIGYVYGGGLRGPIGTKYNPTNININIKGGNIVNDVYGGGSGTLVKIKHKNTNGSVEINDAYGDPTGLAYVYGNITVNMSGGVVNGGVYGGGKSVAVVDTYGGTVIKDKSGNTYFQENVAMVDGNVIVNISGGEVKGDVFGAGKGIDTTKLTTQDAIESEYSSLYVIRNKNFTSTAGLQNSNNLVKSDVSISSDLEFAYIPWAFQNLNNNKKVQVTFKLDDDKYAEFAKVVGNTNVNIYSDCTIRGSVYGGGALGKLYGGTNVHITEGTVIGTVYGGGLGTVGKVSVMGKRKITIGGTANIKGSVYGGSALGTDGLTEGDGVVPYYSGSYNGAYDAIIYLKAGTVDGSIFGGGFQGITNGDTHIFVGANSLELKDVGVLGDEDDEHIDMTIGGSIYLGGDVGVIENSHQAYTQYMVMGKGELYMAKNPTKDNLSFTGSIMGSGNSCLTKGDTTIYLKDLTSFATASGESIHRATNVTIDGCVLELNGRATIENTLGNVNNTDYSLYRIEHLILKNGTILVFNGSINYVYELKSVNANGDPTTSTSPFNKIVVGGGNLFILKKIIWGENSTYTESYGEVVGYTIIAGRSDEYNYGVLAFGNPDSDGGFVVLKSGSFVKADHSDLTDSCRCWYLAGAINNEVTSTVVGHGNMVELSVDMPSLQSGSSYRYTGGTFVPDTPGVADYISTEGDAPLDNQFQVRFGNADAEVYTEATSAQIDAGKYLYYATPAGATPEQIAAGHNLFHSEDGGETLTRATPAQRATGTNLYYAEFEVATPAQISARINLYYSEHDTERLIFADDPDYPQTGALMKDDLGKGDPILGLLEGGASVRNPHMMIQVESKVSEFRYLGYVLICVNEVVAVSINDTTSYVVVNTIQTKVHIYAEAATFGDTSMDISIIDGVGNSTFIIPSGRAGCSMVVDSVTPLDGANGVTAFSVTAVKNMNNTPGWTDNLGTFILRTDGSVSTTTIGTLQGGYTASLLIQVNSFSGTGRESYELEMRILDSNGRLKDSFTLTLNVYRTPDVSVTFQVNKNTQLKYTYSYGTVITLPDCPPTDEHFVGWYTDKDYNNPFTFTIPITKDLMLYACYMYEVTLDYMDGTTSTVYVSMTDGVIGTMADPTRPGYDFAGWYQETEYIHPWNLATDKVTGSKTLYARWVGWNVEVKFMVDFGSGAIAVGLDASKAYHHNGDLLDCQIMEFGSQFNTYDTFILPSGDKVMTLLAWAQYNLEKMPGYTSGGYKFIYWTYQVVDPSGKVVPVYTDSYLTETERLSSTNGEYDKDGDYYIVVLLAKLSKVAVSVNMDSTVIVDGQSVDNLALVDPPSTFLIFPYEESENNWYRMRISLNGATRPGYSLKGWSITAGVITDDGWEFVNRGDPHLYAAGTEIILYIHTNNDATYPWVAEFMVSNETVETVRFNSAGAARLFGTGDNLVFKFQSQWEMIPYSVSIADPAHGDIIATYNIVYTVTGIDLTKVKVASNDVEYIITDGSNVTVTFIPNGVTVSIGDTIDNDYTVTAIDTTMVKETSDGVKYIISNGSNVTVTYVPGGMTVEIGDKIIIPVRFTDTTFYYGDVVSLIFTTDPGYEFHHWYSSGEGLFNAETSPSTTFVIRGDTNISAYLIGPQIVRVFIEYEGLYKGIDIPDSEIPDLYLMNGTDKVYFTKSVKFLHMENGHTLIQYTGTATLGDHEIYLEGRSLGGEYKLGMPITSTTSQNVYYIMTPKELYTMADVTGNTLHDDLQNVDFIVTDLSDNEATVTNVCDSSTELFTISSVSVYRAVNVVNNQAFDNGTFYLVTLASVYDGGATYYSLVDERFYSKTSVTSAEFANGTYYCITSANAYDAEATYAMIVTFNVVGITPDAVTSCSSLQKITIGGDTIYRYGYIEVYTNGVEDHTESSSCTDVAGKGTGIAAMKEYVLRYYFTDIVDIDKSTNVTITLESGYYYYNYPDENDPTYQNHSEETTLTFNVNSYISNKVILGTITRASYNLNIYYGTEDPEATGTPITIIVHYGDYYLEKLADYTGVPAYVIVINKNGQTVNVNDTLIVDGINYKVGNINTDVKTVTSGDFNGVKFVVLDNSNNVAVTYIPSGVTVELNDILRVNNVDYTVKKKATVLTDEFGVQFFTGYSVYAWYMIGSSALIPSEMRVTGAPGDINVFGKYIASTTTATIWIRTEGLSGTYSVQSPVTVESDGQVYYCVEQRAGYVAKYDIDVSTVSDLDTHDYSSTSRPVGENPFHTTPGVGNVIIITYYLAVVDVTIYDANHEVDYTVTVIDTTMVKEASNGVKYIITSGSNVTVTYIPDDVTVEIGDTIDSVYTVTAIDLKKVNVALNGVNYIITSGSNVTVTYIPNGVTVNIDDKIKGGVELQFKFGQAVELVHHTDTDSTHYSGWARAPYGETPVEINVPVEGYSISIADVTAGRITLSEISVTREYSVVIVTSQAEIDLGPENLGRTVSLSIPYGTPISRSGTYNERLTIGDQTYVLSNYTQYEDYYNMLFGGWVGLPAGGQVKGDLTITYHWEPRTYTLRIVYDDTVTVSGTNGTSPMSFNDVVYIVKSKDTYTLTESDWTGHAGVRFVVTDTDNHYATVFFIPEGISVVKGDVFNYGGYQYTVKDINTTIKETSGGVKFIVIDWSNRYAAVTDNGGSVSINDEISQDGPDNTVTVTPSGLGYSAIIRLTMVFTGSYTIDETNSTYINPNGGTYSLQPIKQSSLQQYMFQFFVTGDMEITIKSKWVGEHITFYIQGTDEGTPVIDPSLTLLVGKDEPIYIDISDYEYMQFLEKEGYYFDGWYTNPSFTALPDVAYSDGAYCFRLVGNNSLYARYVPLATGNYELTYDGTAQYVDVVPDIEVPLNTSDISYEWEGGSGTSVSITNYDDGKNGKSITYSFTPRKMYLCDVNGVGRYVMSNVTKVYSGTITLVMNQRPIIVVADSQTWLYDGTSHSDGGYSVFGVITGDTIATEGGITVSGSVTGSSTGVTCEDNVVAIDTRKINSNYTITAYNGSLMVIGTSLPTVTVNVNPNEITLTGTDPITVYRYTVSENDVLTVGNNEYTVTGVISDIRETANHVRFVVTENDRVYVIEVPTGISVSANSTLAVGDDEYTVTGVISEIKETAKGVRFFVANNDVIVIDVPEIITVTQGDVSKEVNDVSVKIVIKNVTIEASGSSAMTIGAGCDVTLVVVGNNELTGDQGYDGIRVIDGACLTVTGRGSLTVKGNAGSDDGFESNKGGSGIGHINETPGVIIIDSMADLSAYGYGMHGYGIGGTDAIVSIYDSTITIAQGGHIVYTDEQAADTGDGGYMNLEGGPGIGGSFIAIYESTITKAVGGTKAAAIGEMFWKPTSVVIDDSTLTEIQGGSYSAGIGGSRQKQGDTNQTIDIRITNSAVTAVGGLNGPGIGSGYDSHCGYNGTTHSYLNQGLCTIVISDNSRVTATGGKYAASIGTGYHHANLTGYLDGSCTIDTPARTSGDMVYKNTYYAAQYVGYGVIDPAREAAGLQVYFYVALNATPMPSLPNA